MRFFRYFLLMTIVSLLFNIGCSKQSENAIDFGKFEKGVYSNAFFNLNISIPDSWYVMDDESRIALMQKGKKILAGDNKNLKATLNAVDINSLNLISTYESPPGKPVPHNPSLVLVTEKVTHLPGIKRGSDYHYHTKKLFKESAIAVSFPKDTYETIIGGKTFDVLEIIYDLGSVNNYQKQYATIINQYALIIIITYQKDEGLNKLNHILQTMNLD